MFIVNFRSCTRFEKEASGQLGVNLLFTHGKISMTLSSLLITSIKKGNLGKILSIKLTIRPSAISLKLYYFSEDSSLLYASRVGIRFCFSFEELEPRPYFAHGIQIL